MRGAPQIKELAFELRKTTDEAVPAAQIRRPAGVQVGGSTASGRTTTRTNALEIHMPPSHQRNTAQRLGGGHAGHSAMNLADTSNRARFVLTVSETRAGILTG
jgi:hypothetical protein